MNQSQHKSTVPFIEKIVKDAQLEALKLQVIALEKALEEVRIRVALIEEKTHND